MSGAHTDPRRQKADVRSNGFDAAPAKRPRAGSLLNLIQIGVLVMVVLISLPMVVQIWGQVSAKLLQLRTSEKDNVIWNLTQLEVEFLKLERSLLAATDAEEVTPNQLGDVRQQFDVYYSRLATLDTGGFYRNAFQIAGTQAALHMIRSEMLELAPLIDQPDPELEASLPQLLAAHQNRSRLVRRIINRGNQYTGQRSQEARDDVSALLLQLSIASVVSFLSLSLATLLLYRNSRGYRANALEYRNASARFAAVIATSPDAVVVTDEKGLIVEFNQAAEELFARSRDIMLGRRLAKYLFGSSGSWAHLPLLTSEPRSAEQFSVRCAKGATVPIELSQGVAEVEGRSFYVYFLRDISDRLAADKAILASRDRALAGERTKSRFLAVMSHEMRTPLNGILGLIEVIESGELSKKDRQRYFDLMRNSGQLLLGHVNDVLEIAKVEVDGLRLNPQAFDLDQMLADLIGPMVVAAQLQENTLTFEAPQAPFGRFHGDSNRLRQVLLNLLSNAIKFTEQGEVCISVSQQLLSPASDAEVKGPRVSLEFQVTDTGIGISELDQARIFEDFVRLDSEGTEHIEGTGLGLGIAKRIVEAMGGEIGVDSLEGEGSVFWVRVTMPQLADGQLVAAAEQDQTGTKAAAIAPQKILVVEDNPTNRLVVRDLLERDGHAVAEEVNGALGLARAQREKFDVIFMDLNMPVMGGLEASQQIRRDSLCRDSRIIALTAHLTERDDAVYQSAGMDAVLSKPLQWNDLRRVLKGEVRGIVPAVQEAGRIDEQHLKKVLAALSPEKAQKLISGVRHEGGALVQQLEGLPSSGLSAAQREALMRAVHTMAGSASMMGARQLRNALNTLESELETSEAVDLLKWKNHLTKIWCATLGALEDAGREELKEDYEN
ncbi:ATP-binding protein [Thalassobius sp. Cn5-15]|uniref:ATP-binding protein n=1 Tax=Thalassobius sp. Cn5-15 TaxID=2917763 RepID=UPI001EF1D923|nr:ATP-binding protein [Thalassobius sp. Cn5-15]MCG7492632.1 ATP-binding protein [Thalassobius sp. Cn5-15]